MMLGYTFKLLLSNFSNVWKMLLYRIICLLCVLGLTTVVFWPIINTLIRENFFVNVQSTFEGFLFNLNIENLFVNVDSVIKNFCEIISKNGYVLQAVLCGVMFIILFVFLEGYGKFAMTESINGYMSSLTKYSFVNSYVANFGKATLHNLISLITIVPINLVIWIGTYLFASNLYSKIGVFAIVLAFFIATILLALKNTAFSGWRTASIVHNATTFGSLKKGFVSIKKRFFRGLSNYLLLVIIAVVLNVLALTLTAAVGLFITMPLVSLMFAIANQVNYYEAMGMRFYIDSDRIISPKKLEQQDSFAKVKHLI